MGGSSELHETVFLFSMDDETPNHETPRSIYILYILFAKHGKNGCFRS